MSNFVVTVFNYIFHGKAARIAALILGMVMIIAGLFFIHQVVVWAMGIGLAALGLISFIVAAVTK